MIKRWLKHLFTEAWKDYESQFFCSIIALRDPNDQDKHYRPGTEWENKITEKKFILTCKWKEVK